MIEKNNRGGKGKWNNEEDEEEAADKECGRERDIHR